jgi:hypothetical protein
MRKTDAVAGRLNEYCGKEEGGPARVRRMGQNLVNVHKVGCWKRRK